MSQDLGIGNVPIEAEVSRADERRSRKCVLSVDSLTIRFATARGVIEPVSNVSFDVYAGECVAIVGESGSGKSVTATAITGLLPRSNSQVTAKSMVLDGKDLIGLREKEFRHQSRRIVGLVFQDPNAALNPLKRIGSQVREGLRLSGVPNDETREAARRLLDEVGLNNPEAVEMQYPHELSGGMKQRAAVAVALSTSPRLLIADEPTTALDASKRFELVDLLKRLMHSRQMGLVLISHDLGMVGSVADRTVVMYAGHVMESGPTQQLITEPRHPYTYGLLKSIPRLDDEPKSIFFSMTGRIPQPGSLIDGCVFAPRCQSATDVCRQKLPPLVQDVPADGGQAVGEPGTAPALACWQPLRWR